MAEQSFIFLDRVSAATERNIWRQGIPDWQSFLRRERIAGISPARKLYYDRQILRAQAALTQKNLRTLADLFPRNQHWRLYDICTDVFALDIETSGYYGDVTVVGLHDGAEPFFLVKNKNLSHEPLMALLREPCTLLTFNGSSFDLPVLIRRFPEAQPRFVQHVHIDLRHVAARLGYTGGLKTIEIIHGIAREEEIQGVSGDVAVWLWRQYEVEGDEDALRTLLLYNEADVKNLFILAEKLIPELWRTTYKSAQT